MSSLTRFKLLSKYPNQALGRVITSPAFIHILFAIRFLLLPQAVPNMNSIMKILFLFCFNQRNKTGTAAKSLCLQIPNSYSHCIETENEADEGDRVMEQIFQRSYKYRVGKWLLMILTPLLTLESRNDLYYSYTGCD